jgi:ferredoxin-like protein FixX
MDGTPQAALINVNVAQYLENPPPVATQQVQVGSAATTPSCRETAMAKQDPARSYNKEVRGLVEFDGRGCVEQVSWKAIARRAPRGSPRAADR